MKLRTQVVLGPGHIVLDGDPGPPPQRGTVPQFSVHVYCGCVAKRSPISATAEHSSAAAVVASPVQ